MTLREFHNALRIMLSIDRHELEAAGIIVYPDAVYPGYRDEGNQLWERFQADPFGWLIHAGDDQAQKLWSIIEARQMKPAASGQALENPWNLSSRSSAA